MALQAENVQSLAAFNKAIAAHSAAVVHFWAAWCEPCKFLDAVLQQLGADAPAVALLRVEAEEVPDVSEAQCITVVPTFSFYRVGQLVDRLEGADAAALTAKFKALTGGATGAAAAAKGAAAPAAERSAGQPSASGRDDLQARLKALVNQQPVMIFMKGTPDAPRCGFSRKVVEAVRAAGCTHFGSFDILEDEEVRQGVKEFSSWPTYPQLYVNGELLGGCDFVLEMAAAGELRDALDAAEGRQLQARLQALVNQQPVMLFMKGTPDAPRCGFSRKVVEALRVVGEPFGSFDILEDEEVRQGLKEFSSWPTYPQLYVNGELLGGCDIVLEMAEAGELRGTIDEMKEIS
eukprot:scaffold16.g35.t1